MKIKIRIVTTIDVDNNVKYCGQNCQWDQDVYDSSGRPICSLFDMALRYNSKTDKMLRCKKCREAK